MGDFADDPFLAVVLIASLAPLFLFVLIAYMPIVGVVLSPIAGVMGIAIAMRKRLNVLSTLVLSMMYSCASVFLWTFFILSVFGKRVAPCYRGLAYILGFMYWLLLILWLSFETANSPDAFYQDLGPIHIRFTFIVLPISALTWIVSLVRIIRLDESTLPEEDLNSFVDLRKVLARSPSVMPFALSSAWSLVCIAALLLDEGKYFRGQATSVTINTLTLSVSVASLIWIFWPWIIQIVELVRRPGDESTSS